MTEIPEHLLQRARRAREKADARAGDQPRSGAISSFGEREASPFSSPVPPPPAAEQPASLPPLFTPPSPPQPQSSRKLIDALEDLDVDSLAFNLDVQDGAPDRFSLHLQLDASEADAGKTNLTATVHVIGPPDLAKGLGDAITGFIKSITKDNEQEPARDDSLFGRIFGSR